MFLGYGVFKDVFADRHKHYEAASQQSMVGSESVAGQCLG